MPHRARGCCLAPGTIARVHRRPGRPLGQISVALIAAFREHGPQTVREAAIAAQVGIRAARVTAARLVERGQVVPADDAVWRRRLKLADDGGGHPPTGPGCDLADALNAWRVGRGTASDRADDPPICG